MGNRVPQKQPLRQQMFQQNQNKQKKKNISISTTFISDYFQFKPLYQNVQQQLFIILKNYLQNKNITVSHGKLQYKSKMQLNQNQLKMVQYTQSQYGLQKMLFQYADNKNINLQILNWQEKLIFYFQMYFLFLSEIKLENIKIIGFLEQKINFHFFVQPSYTKLKILQISHQEIVSIEWLQLMNFPNLQHLNLQSNCFTTAKSIRKTIFQKLTRLNLSMNEVSQYQSYKELDCQSIQVIGHLKLDRAAQHFNEMQRVSMDWLILLKTKLLKTISCEKMMSGKDFHIKKKYLQKRFPLFKLKSEPLNYI